MDANEELEDIFSRIVKNDNAALYELFNKYSRYVYVVANSYLNNPEDASDIVQNVFLKIIQLKKESLPTKSFSSWLYVVAKNESLQNIKKSKNSKEILYENMEMFTSEYDNVRDAINDEYYKSLVENLDPISSQIVGLKVLCGYKHREIAQILDLPIGTVQWKYFVSIKQLREIVGSVIVIIFTSASYFIIKANMLPVGYDDTQHEFNYLLVILENILEIICSVIFIILFIRLLISVNGYLNQKIKE